MKILVASIHPEEWNQYIPFNGYLSGIKKDYDYIIAVVAYKPLILISEADEYYTVKDGDSNFSYPNLLNTSARENHDFIDRCISQVKIDFKNDDLHFISWQNTNETKGVVDIHDNAAIVYRTSFKNAQEWYKTGKLIYPTLKSYNNVLEKFGHLFTEKTFIVLSRNYSNKAPVHNSKNSITNFESMLSYLSENEIKIINIGFPSVSCDIKNENYIELNESMTQDELISLFYLSSGVLMQSDAGGFVSHFSSNSDFFILTDQWYLAGEFDSFDILSHKTKDVDTIDISKYLKTLANPDNTDDFESILLELKSHNSKKSIIFEKEKKITFVE